MQWNRGVGDAEKQRRAISGSPRLPFAVSFGAQNLNGHIEGTYKGISTLAIAHANEGINAAGRNRCIVLRPLLRFMVVFH